MKLLQAQTVRWCAILTILSPLVIWTSLPYPASSARLVWLAAVSVIAAVALIATHKRERLTMIESAALLFVAVQIFASLVSNNPTESFFGSLERSTGVVLLVLAIPLYGALKITYQNERAIIFRTTVITLALMSLIAIAQAVAPNFLPTFSGGRVGGTLGNTVILGTYLVLTLLLILYDARRNDWFAWGTCALATIALLLTQTRASWIALGVAVCIIVVFYARQKNISPRRWIIGGIAVAVVAGIFIWWQAPRFTHLVTTQTVASRLVNWHMAWRGFIDQPLLGWGPNRYHAAVDANFDPSMNRFGETESFPDKPHNFHVELLATSGALGAISYALLLIAVGYTVVRQRALWMLGVFFVARELQLAFSFETHGSLIPTLMALAIIGAHAQPWRVRVPQFASYALVIVVAAISWWGVVRPLINFNMRPQLTDPYLFERWDTQREQALAEPRQRSIFFALTDELQKKHADSARWNHAISVAMLQLYTATHDGQFLSLAQQTTARSMHITPARLPVVVQHAQLFLLAKQYDAAYTTAEQAIRLNPTTRNAHWIAATAALGLKDGPRAWHHLERLIAQQFDFKKIPTPLFQAFVSLLQQTHLTDEAQQLLQTR